MSDWHVSHLHPALATRVFTVRVRHGLMRGAAMAGNRNWRASVNAAAKKLAAYERLESIVWPNGPVCPHCGNADPKRVYRVAGKTARAGIAATRIAEFPDAKDLPTFREMRGIFQRLAKMPPEPRKKPK